MAQLELKHHFINGPFLEVEQTSETLLVDFLDGEEVIHSGEINTKEWIRASRRWFSNWTIRVSDLRGVELYSHHFQLRGQNVRVYIDSKSLGDTLAWIPQVERFADAHPQTTVYVSYHWSGLIDESAYSNLVFIPPEAELSPCYATYSIGYYFEDIENHHPYDPRTRSLQEVASDILGLASEERLPRLIRAETAFTVSEYKPTVTVATTSTAKCKHWLAENGWQTIIDWLVNEGYEVEVIQKEHTDLENITNKTGDYPIGDRIDQIQDSEFFIGLASGLSWLAWALEKPVVMISGFSLPETEFLTNCERVINYDVCHGCWNDVRHEFARNEWNWCPRQEGTYREHECSREISVEMVLQAIQSTIKQIHNLME